MRQQFAVLKISGKFNLSGTLRGDTFIDALEQPG